jgi:phosphatidylserine decarboxylase
MLSPAPQALSPAHFRRSDPLMSSPKPLPVFDRKKGQLVEEFMDDAKATYETRPHRSLWQFLESHPLYDWCVALQQNTRRSAKKIEPFIRKHGIDMSEFKPAIYRSYAEFFDREFRPGVRTFPSDPTVMGAFGEARYFGWERLDPAQQLPIKGHSLSPARLLGDAQLAKPFEGGPVLLARLSPMDYHHLHYFDDGVTKDRRTLGSRLWTVNWHALQNKPDLLFRNERSIQILETKHFGQAAFVEIGALSVGRIVQVHPLKTPFARGDEKSLFKFGGSAVVVMGRPGAWKPSADILSYTAQNTEVLVQLGDQIARAA